MRSADYCSRFLCNGLYCMFKIVVDLRRAWKHYFIAALTGICVLVGGTFHRYWDYNRETVRYYADYVDVYGVPQGLFPLSKTQIAQRAEHYRFESLRNKVRRIVHANSSGTAIPHEDDELLFRPAIQQLTYDDKAGRLIYTDYFDSKAMPTVRLAYSGDKHTTIDFERSTRGGDAAHAWLNAGTTAFGSDLFGVSGVKNRGKKSGVQRWKIARDTQGRIARIEFKRLKSDTPVKDADGVFGFEYDLDEIGRVVELRYLDYDNRFRTTKTGIAGRKYEYDGSHRKRTMYIDDQGRPVPNEQGWAVTEESFDSLGNVRVGRYYGRDGRPVLSKEHIAEYRYEYDIHGNRTAGAFFGTDGKPIVHALGCASFKAEHDPFGNVVRAEYFGGDGNPCFLKDGFASVTIKYDGHNNPIERSYFGVDGKPCRHVLGHARIVMRYDEHGNLTEQIHFGLDGQKSLNEGVATFKTKYDNLGNWLSAAYFGVDDKWRRSRCPLSVFQPPCSKHRP